MATYSSFTARKLLPALYKNALGLGACIAAGLAPQVLPPFSLTTRELPELGGNAELNQVKQTAFTTSIGQASGFEQNNVGGFVLYVQSQLPIDQSVMNAEMPQYLTSLRRSRESEAFNEWVNQAFGTWLQTEAGKALRDRLNAPAGR